MKTIHASQRRQKWCGSGRQTCDTHSPRSLAHRPVARGVATSAVGAVLGSIDCHDTANGDGVSSSWSCVGLLRAPQTGATGLREAWPLRTRPCWQAHPKTLATAAMVAMSINTPAAVRHVAWTRTPGPLRTATTGPTLWTAPTSLPQQLPMRLVPDVHRSGMLCAVCGAWWWTFCWMGVILV